MQHMEASKMLPNIDDRECSTWDNLTFKTFEEGLWEPFEPF
jgi:hypothetical protein